MESLTYVFEERGLAFPDDIELQVDGLLRNRNLLKGWESEPLLFSGWDGYESMGFNERDMTRKSFLVNQCLDNSGYCAKGDSGYSSSSIKANEHKFVPSGLKIEKLGVQKDRNDSQLSSPESSSSAKRARVSNFQSQIPFCQVLGCNKDLSSSKDYHKRHKVCDVHSKTAVVIVNGIRQRFCQQCSRFHVLAEFDEGKRSCRKRLAGHNERRRKPQLDAHLGSAFLGTDISRTSLFFSRLHPGSFFGKQCNEPITRNMHIKLEDSSQISQLGTPMNFGPSFSKSLLHLHGMGKRHPSKYCLNGQPSDQESLYAADSNSSFALSLLSVQSQKLPGISKENHRSKFFVDSNSDESLGKSMLKDFSANGFNLSNGFGQEEFPAVAPGVSGIPHGKISLEGANTLDLLQLSVHLQRVEQQKYSTQVEVGK